MSALRVKLSGFGFAEIWSLGIAYCYLLEAGWLLFVRRQKLDRWIAKTALTDSVPPLSEKEREFVISRARWFGAAARHPFQWARCLQRSLGLCLWMEHHGLIPELKIGVRMQEGALEAHAWVENAGKVLNDSPGMLQGFVALKGASLKQERRWV